MFEITNYLKLRMIKFLKMKYIWTSGLVVLVDITCPEIPRLTYVLHM